MSFASCHTPRPLLRRQPTATPGVPKCGPAFPVLLGLFGQVLLAAETRIPGPAIHEASECGSIGLVTLTLPIRTMRTAYVGTFVPVESEPTQVLHDRLLSPLNVTLRVRILHAEDEAPPVASGQ
jgi:hypothetical protein